MSRGAAQAPRRHAGCGRTRCPLPLFRCGHRCGCP
jgi:hypothetical protein